MDVELKKRIIDKASELFRLHGIRSVTMDTIAHETGISKRTLYENFADKDALLLATLEYQEERNQKERQELAKQCSSSLELNLKEYERVSRGLRVLNRNYLSDLHKYHPKVALFWEKNRQAGMERMVAIIEEGMKDGYIRTGLNSKLLALLLRVQLEVLLTSGEIEENDFSFSEVFETIVMNYARGIATPKGVELLEKYTEDK